MSATAWLRQCVALFYQPVTRLTLWRLDWNSIYNRLTLWRGNRNSGGNAAETVAGEFAF